MKPILESVFMELETPYKNNIIRIRMNRFFTILLMVINVLYVVDNSCCGNTTNKVTLPTFTHKELRQSILGGNFDAIVINRDCTQYIDTPISSVEQIFNELQKYVTKEKWTFVVFSETFFGNNGRMTQDQANNIVDKCNHFSAEHRNILIHINFLHTFTNDNRPRWLPLTGIQEGIISEDRIDTNIPENIRSSVFALRDINYRISNYSILIWSGIPISFYRKSTYCRETDGLLAIYNGVDIIPSEYMYEFGDFQDHVLEELDEEHRNLANILFPVNGEFLINTRICYDLNIMNELNNSVKLLIVNADQAPIIESWQSKIPNDQLFCIHADMWHQNYSRMGAQASDEECAVFPYWSYSFFNKKGRFVAIRCDHSLKSVLSFFKYDGVSNQFMGNSAN